MAHSNFSSAYPEADDFQQTAQQIDKADLEMARLQAWCCFEQASVLLFKAFARARGEGVRYNGILEEPEAEVLLQVLDEATGLKISAKDGMDLEQFIADLPVDGEHQFLFCHAALDHQSHVAATAAQQAGFRHIFSVRSQIHNHQALFPLAVPAGNEKTQALGIAKSREKKLSLSSEKLAMLNKQSSWPANVINQQTSNKVYPI